MIKNIVSKALILTLGAFLFFCVFATRVDASRLYELDNVVENGDFSTVGWWSIAGAPRIYYENGRMVFDGVDTSYIGIGKASSLIIGNKYYIRAEKEETQGRIVFEGISESTIFQSNVGFTGTAIYDYLAFKRDGITKGWIDNILIFNLTVIFGAGNEPTASDFELLYLPDLQYFDFYSSFDPLTYTQLNDSDYPSIGDDLTGIDYTKSIVSRNGTNIDLDVQMYFYDTPNQSGVLSALYYRTFNFPEIKIFDKVYTLSWEVSDYSNRVNILTMSDVEENALKQVLFNRNIDPDNEYFTFTIEAMDYDILYDYAKVWFVLSSVFDLVVDVRAFMISREVKTDNAFNIQNEMYIKTYDRAGNLYLPALMMNLAGDEFQTIFVDDFGSSYTNISKFNFEFLFTSPDPDDPYLSEAHYFYELGMFSSNEVIQISPISSDIGLLFPQQVCDWFQFGCHATNIINDVGAKLYVSLNIQSFIDSIDSVFASVSSFLDILPDELAGIIIAFTTALAGGIILVIYRQATKEE